MRIILCYVLSGCLLLPWLALPTPARAAACLSQGDAFVVTGACAITAAGSYGPFSRVEVQAGGSLMLGAGVRLELLPGAEVSVEGAFAAIGADGAPVVLTGTPSWEGFSAGGQARVHLEHVRLERFVEPVALRAPPFIKDLVLRDGRENVLSLDATETAFPFLRMEDLRFENWDLREGMANGGIRARGSFDEIEVWRITFVDPRRQFSEAGPWIGLEVEGSYQGVTVAFGYFPEGCSMRFDSGRTGLSRIRYRPSRCPDRILPTVFVPGYGTSFNLRQLSNPDPKPYLEGWKFFDRFSPAYRRFLDIFKASGVPVSVAYYDWRQPAGFIAEHYLLPAIERAKREYGTDKVDIVAHSFGGLAARAYVQGDRYGNDVRKVVLLGTPNQGAAKAYQVWEGGVLPSEWQAAGHLVRYYQHRDKKRPGFVQTLRKHFPSLKQMLPTYPVLGEAAAAALKLRCETNDWLQALNEDNYRRHDHLPPLTRIVSKGFATPDLLKVGRSDCRRTLWPDGELITPVEGAGDGTVSLAGAALPGTNESGATGRHADLPESEVRTVLRELHPTLLPIVPPKPSPSRFQNALSFLFDCPVTVTITLPNGVMVSSESASEWLEQDRSDDLLWMMVPSLPGRYEVRVTATAETDVTAWTDDGPDRTFHLKQGERARWELDPADLSVLSPMTFLPSESPPPLSLPPSASPSPAPGPAPVPLLPSPFGTTEKPAVAEVITPIGKVFAALAEVTGLSVSLPSSPTLAWLPGSLLITIAGPVALSDQREGWWRGVGRWLRQWWETRRPFP